MTRIDVGSLGEYIREQRKLAQLSLRQLAANAGVSNPYLSQIERGARNPSAEILGQLAKALSISAETLYIRAGILEDRGGDVLVTTAIMADVTITDRQRRVLLEVYGAFQSENVVSASWKQAEQLQDAEQHQTTNETAYADTSAARGQSEAVDLTVDSAPSPRVVSTQEPVHAAT